MLSKKRHDPWVLEDNREGIEAALPGAVLVVTTGSDGQMLLYRAGIVSPEWAVSALRSLADSIEGQT